MSNHTPSNQAAQAIPTPPSPTHSAPLLCSGSRPRKPQNRANTRLHHPVRNRQETALRRGGVVGGNVRKPGHDADTDDHEAEQANEHPTGQYVPTARGIAATSGAVAVRAAGAPSPARRWQKPQHAGHGNAEKHQPNHHETEPHNLI